MYRHNITVTADTETAPCLCMQHVQSNITVTADAETISLPVHVARTVQHHRHSPFLLENLRKSFFVSFSGKNGSLPVHVSRSVEGAHLTVQLHLQTLGRHFPRQQAPLRVCEHLVLQQDQQLTAHDHAFQSILILCTSLYVTAFSNTTTSAATSAAL